VKEKEGSFFTSALAVRKFALTSTMIVKKDLSSPSLYTHIISPTGNPAILMSEMLKHFSLESIPVSERSNLKF